MGKNLNIIFDNIIYFLQRTGGGSVYWFELTRRIKEFNNFNIKYIEYKYKENNFLTNQRANLLGNNIIFSFIKPLLATVLPIVNFHNSKYIFHSSYYRYSIDSKSINVITIHDFIPEKYFNGVSKYIAIYRKRMAIKYAKGIICVSHNTYNDLINFYPKVINKKIEVIYNGVSNDYYILNGKNIKNDILFIGKRDHYKNFDLAVKVVSLLKDFRLVIVGNELQENELELIMKYNINYTLYSSISNNRLNEIYNESFCLLYPSSYEGFGIPVIEAMKAGCPVVALDASSVSEISNGAALLAKELNPLEFSKLIKLLENIEFRTQLVKKGIQNASYFSWDRTALETSNFYLKLIDETE